MFEIMASDLESEYANIVSKANEYHKKALWQEKLRLLQDAERVANSPEFPRADERRQDLYYDYGSIWRRLGQYDRAEKELQRALEVFPEASKTKRSNILGELAVVLRHANRFAEARDVSREQFVLAQNSPPSLERDIEMCRAIGNEGMSNYNLYMTQPEERRDRSLLDAAFAQLRDRITRSRLLQERVRTEAPNSRWVHMSKAWETIGMDRLTLCHIAAGETKEAVRNAEASQSLQTREDPTVTAYSRFFHGYALWSDGQREAAVRKWNAPPGVCSCPMVFCKEPSQEHNEYMKLMAVAGVKFDSFDEQGFSALDYAVLSGDNPDAKAAIPIIIERLRAELMQDARANQSGNSEEEIEASVNSDIALREHQAQLRRQYRNILQEHIRPELRTNDQYAFRKLRKVYSKFLSDKSTGRRLLSSFIYVKFTDFVDHGKLPVSSAGLTRDSAATEDNQTPDEDDYIIFFSYRWAGKDNPDNEENVQWGRMVDAAEQFLAANKHIARERLGVWLDYACIDQVDLEEKARGVDALPLAVTLCNAMISLMDEIYYERAWCRVETLLIYALKSSYGLHQWLEHVLVTPDTNKTRGVVRQAGIGVDMNPDLRSLKLTKERLDRPKIDFLMRQSKLLGKDTA